MLVHRALNPADESGVIDSHTAPDHDRAAAMLDRLLDVARLAVLPVTHPAPRSLVRAEAIDLGLI